MIRSWIKKCFTQTPAHYSDAYETYRLLFRDISYSGRIEKQDFVIIDTETTGLDPEHDSVIAIGAVRVKSNIMDVTSSLSMRLKTDDSSRNPKAIEIHGLIQTDHRGLLPEEAIQKLYAYLGTDIIVGHHIRFDILMLEKLSKACGGGPLLNKVIDTATLARRVDNPHGDSHAHPGDYTLDQLCKRYHIVTKARHTADGDAYITAILFLKLLHRLQKKGVQQIKEILR